MESRFSQSVKIHSHPHAVKLTRTGREALPREQRRLARAPSEPLGVASRQSARGRSAAPHRIEAERGARNPTAG